MNIGSRPGIGGVASTVGIVVTVTVDPAIQAFRKLSDQVSQHTNSMQRRLGALTGGFREFDRTLGYIVAATVVGLTAKFVGMAAELQRTAALLVTMEGSTAKANQQLDNMFTLANKVPFSLQAITGAFLKLKSSGIEPILDSQGNGPLRNLLDAVAAFGGTEDNLNRAAVALQQMAGKGVISMEELRQQLGEAVPTAIRVMAEQMHVSVAQLVADISKGNVDALTGLAALSEGFRIHYGGIAELIKKSTLSGAFQSLETEINKMAVALNKMGVTDLFTAAINLLTDGLKALNQQLLAVDASGWIDKLLTAIGNNADYIARFANTLLNFASILGIVFGTIMDLLSTLPPEALAGGLVGFALFGPKAALFGALIGMISEQLGVLVAAVAGVVSGIDSVLKSAGLGNIGEVAAWGLVGFLVAGKKGGMIGIVVSIVDKLLTWVENRVSDVIMSLRAGLIGITVLGGKVISGEAFTNPAGAVADSYAAAFKSMSQQRADWKKFRAEDSAAAKKMIGFGDGAVGPQVQAGQIKSASEAMKSYLADIRNARKQLGEMNKDPINNMQGLNAAQLKQYSDLLDDIARAEDRAFGAENGPGAQYMATQSRKLEQFDKLIGDVKKSQQALISKGDVKGAAELGSEINTLTKQYDNYKKAVGTVVAAEEGKANARLGAKASRAAAKLQRENQTDINQIKDLQSNLEQFTAKLNVIKDATYGVNEFQAATDKAINQTAGYVDQLNQMAIQVSKLKHHDKERAAILLQIASIQADVNKVTEAAIELEKRKVQWQIEADQLQAKRESRDMSGDLQGKWNSVKGFNKENELKSFMDEWQSVKDKIDDEITQYKHKIEENANSVQTEFWRGRIEDLENIKTAHGDYYEYMISNERRLNEATRDMWLQTGQIIRSSIEDSIYALITGTGSLKDIVLSMFAEITKAAIQYIMKLFIIKVLQSSGNPILSALGNVMSGTMPGLSGMGGGGGGTTVSMNANGNVFDKGKIRKFGSGAAFTNKVVTGPTNFHMGEMGEAGPEGIMPLANVGGKLGVHAKGGGDQYHISIQALDGASVAELFFKHGDDIVNALRSQGRLNNPASKTRWG